MNILRKLSIVGIVVMIGIFAASFVAESSYTARAQLVQRVKTDPGADLFGDVGTPVGTAQQLIIEDSKAFTGDKNAEGAAIVDEDYLMAHSIYPLQLKTVTYVAGLIRVGTMVAMAVCGLVLLIIRRKARSVTPQGLA